ncbi:HPr family phosphocarrier protein [Qiania dongpingensis]|uniref:HPr family phosphocarrier protein n=1 Tax=Qiania dongpingensis TaxID=2763669 RepID=A0A7G9G377_9FIRM|nr:HPr family phosphocarrier protein [Qiania dongpingensis]QNM05259.1 HPr family phosphocarrier protein [Qiania dongpingensis]
MRKRIQIHEADDIMKINRIVSQYTYDIWIHSKSGMVDAKSLLGMFILSLKEDMFVVVEDDIDAGKLFEELGDYLIEEP